MTPTEMLRTMADRPDETWRREEMTSFDDLLVVRELVQRHEAVFVEYGGPDGVYARWRLTPAGRAVARRGGGR